MEVIHELLRDPWRCLGCTLRSLSQRYWKMIPSYCRASSNLIVLYIFSVKPMMGELHVHLRTCITGSHTSSASLYTDVALPSTAVPTSSFFAAGSPSARSGWPARHHSQPLCVVWLLQRPETSSVPSRVGPTCSPHSTHSFTHSLPRSPVFHSGGPVSLCTEVCSY